jgi:uncharacterized membrane protein
MTDWLEHSILIEVEVPIDTVWNWWADLERMPEWMNWIDRVKVSADDPTLSTWTLKALNLEFNWHAKLTKVVPHQIIQWESIDGLANRGAVRFYPRKASPEENRNASTAVKLSVAYGVPGIVGQLMDNLFLGRFVESTLRADMERFRTAVLSQYNL